MTTTPGTGTPSPSTAPPWSPALPAGRGRGAVAQLTRAWAAEFGRSGVRVNAVSPGPTTTEGTAQFGDFIGHLASQAPAGRTAEPEEIAAIDFLVSDDGRLAV